MHPCLEKYSNQFPIQHSFLSSVYRVSVLSISHQTSICWHDLPLFDVTSLATLSRNNLMNWKKASTTIGILQFGPNSFEAL